jgi:UDP-N-acetylmuramate dehydrogenase
MLNIQYQVSLKPYNTFGIEVFADRFIVIHSEKELRSVLESEKDIFVLGGGSNLLLTQNIEKLVVLIRNKGKKITPVGQNKVLVSCEAGEDWHQFVLWCIENNFGGLENLSLIPGNVGTCPIQNIGAYGVEVKDTIAEVETLEIATGKTKIFQKDDCNFEYRNSNFKNNWKGKYIITRGSFVLTTDKHQLNTSYGAIQEILSKKGIQKPSIKEISDAVVEIRNSKLPNPKEIGNSGSFFKNPVVSKTIFIEIQKKNKQVPHYVVSEDEIKIPAGWLIEQCGFKGKRIGNTGSHEKQALVLVNYGGATGTEILDLAQTIQTTVANKFSINLEMEVNTI